MRRRREGEGGGVCAIAILAAITMATADDSPPSAAPSASGAVVPYVLFLSAIGGILAIVLSSRLGRATNTATGPTGASILAAIAAAVAAWGAVLSPPAAPPASASAAVAPYVLSLTALGVLFTVAIAYSSRFGSGPSKLVGRRRLSSSSTTRSSVTRDSSSHESERERERIRRKERRKRWRKRWCEQREQPRDGDDAVSEAREGSGDCGSGTVVGKGVVGIVVGSTVAAFPSPRTSTSGSRGGERRDGARRVVARRDESDEDDLIVDDTDSLRHMARALPESTPAERRRFLAKRGGRATDVEGAIVDLGRYLAWRKQHCDWAELLARKASVDTAVDGDGEGREEKDYRWQYACRKSLHASEGEKGRREKRRQRRPETDPDNTADLLPCVIFVDDRPPYDGDDGGTPSSLERQHHVRRRYLHHLPARIDPSLASASTYALALALYVDAVLHRRSTERIVLAIDLRSKSGWANPPVHHLIPFIRCASKLLNELHPERLEKCVLFPVPKFVANVIYRRMVRPFLDPGTAGKICLVPGDECGRDAPVPYGGLEAHLEREAVERMEWRRAGAR